MRNKCKTCKYLGEEERRGRVGFDNIMVPVCRKHAPRKIHGVGTGSNDEQFPEVDPETDWCGEWVEE